MKPFFDSNILVYAHSTDARRERGIQVLARGGKISARVLNEFTNVLRKKQRLEWSVITEAVASIRKHFPDIAPLTSRTNAKALELAHGHGFSFYDALIIAAAIEAGCDTLYSEDLQNGRAVEGLTIVNPFIAAN